MALLDDLRGKLKDYWRDKYDERTGDGTKTIWKLSKAPVTSQVITVATSTLTEDNEYSIDKDTGIVTFLSGAPGDNTGWTATYQYAIFSDDQHYTFLNNSIKAISEEVRTDTYTDLNGTKNLYHFDRCEATALWDIDNYAVAQVKDTTNYKEGEASLDLGYTTTANSWTYDNIKHSILEDPGFEAGTWETSAKTVAGSYTVAQTAQAMSGTYSLLLINHQTGAWVNVSSEFITCEPGDTFNTNVWIKNTPNASGTHMKAVYYTTGGASALDGITQPQFPSALYLTATAATWISYSGTFTVPQSAAIGAFALLINGGKASAIGATGFTYVDNVTVKKAESNAVYYKTFNQPFDISKYDYLNGWAWIDSHDPLDDRKALEVRLGNDSANYYQYQWGIDILKEQDWNHVSCAFSDMSAVGTVSESSVDYFEVRFNANPNTSMAISSGGLRMDDWRFSTFPIASTNQLEYRLPKRWDVAHRAEAWDESGYRGKLIQFETVGDHVRFDEVASDGTHYKLFGYKEFDTLYSSGSYATDMPRKYNEMIINHAAAEALETLLFDRTRFAAYQTYAANQNVSVGSIQNAATYYRKLFQTDLDRFNNMEHATEIAPAIED